MPFDIPRTGKQAPYGPDLLPRTWRSGLAVLTNLGTADLHLVADDYTSGDWASRLGGFTATLVGSAPTKNPASGSTLPGRSELTGFTTTNCFTLAADAAHTMDGASTITYECVVKAPASGGGVVCIGYGGGTTPNNQGFVLGGNFTSLTGNMRVFSTTTGGTYLGDPALASTWTAVSRYHMMTVVVNIAAPSFIIYQNGTAIGTYTTPSGSLLTTPHGLGIGVFLDTGGGKSSAWGNSGAIVEIMRHRVAMDASTVAARCAAFNLVRGY